MCRIPILFLCFFCQRYFYFLLALHFPNQSIVPSSPLHQNHPLHDKVFSSSPEKRWVNGVITFVVGEVKLSLRTSYPSFFSIKDFFHIVFYHAGSGCFIPTAETADTSTDIFILDNNFFTFNFVFFWNALYKWTCQFICIVFFPFGLPLITRIFIFQIFRPFFLIVWNHFISFVWHVIIQHFTTLNVLEMNIVFTDIILFPIKL